jgi:hypothetical protein
VRRVGAGGRGRRRGGRFRSCRGPRPKPSDRPRRVCARRELSRTGQLERVETITGRQVVAFLSQAHLDPDITLEIFFFDRPMNGAAALDLNIPEALTAAPTARP